MTIAIEHLNNCTGGQCCTDGDAQRYGTYGSERYCGPLVAVYGGPFEEWREIAYEFAGKGPVNADALRPWTHALSILLLLLFRQRSKINHECAPLNLNIEGRYGLLFLLLLLYGTGCTRYSNGVFRDTDRRTGHRYRSGRKEKKGGGSNMHHGDSSYMRVVHDVGGVPEGRAWRPD